MADDRKNGSSTPQRFLEPPAVTALRQEARESNPSSPAPMQRTLSEDIREQCEDLKEAAEQTLNVVMDLDMEGRINWVSPSWKEIIGTEAEDAEGQLIRDLIFDSKAVFEEASENLARDDSRSQIVRFAIKVGPASIFWHEPSQPEEKEAFSHGDQNEEVQGTPQDEEENVLSLEGQGIMVYEQASGGGGHVSARFMPYCAINPCSQPNTDYVDVTSIHKPARSDHWSSSPACRVAWGGSRDARSLSDSPCRRWSQRSCPSSSPNAYPLPHL